jgi:TnpA family transposase
MAHRIILTKKQRHHLLALPADEPTLLNHYVFNDDDLSHIHKRLTPHNRFGFALQLCAFRYPGRYLHKGEVIPKSLLAFVAAQLGIAEEVITRYAKRPETRYHHTKELRRIYQYTPYSKSPLPDILNWLTRTAVDTRSNAELAELFVVECRKRRIILPGITVIERLCADARVAAEREITGRIASRLDERMKKHLHAMLEETVEERFTIYSWLKRYEAGHNSADVNRLLDKLEYLQELHIHSSVLEGIPAHRVIWLRQQGEAYYADGLRDINETRRLAILAVCATQWKAMTVDAVLETHDRIIGKLYSSCKRMRDEQLADQKKVAHDTLTAFTRLGKQLLAAHANNTTITEVVQDCQALEILVATATALTNKLDSDPLDYVLHGYSRFRRYTQRMLEVITFEGNQAAQPLLEAIAHLKQLNHSDKQQYDTLLVSFAGAAWRKRLGSNPERKLWETALLFTLRDALRSRDVWVQDSRLYRDNRQQLVPVAQAEMIASLPIPLQPESWISQRKMLLQQRITQVSRMMQQGILPNSCIKDGTIHMNRLEAHAPEGLDILTLELYKQMPEIPITQILREVDADTGFTDSFTHIHTGSPCGDKVGLLNILLAGGINMGLKKMALCSSSHPSFWSLRSIANWYVTSETMADALAIVNEQHSYLPLASIWGDGSTSSSDGQFFPAGGSGEAMNLINARYGMQAGIKAYTHVSDQYAPFAMKTIPATAHEAPYILDGLTMNDTGKRIKEHYADTGGFTDHVFALCALLGYQFAPRLRNLSSLRLYGMQGVTPTKILQELITARVNLTRIEQQWSDIVRLIASIITHKVVPSEILRQLVSFPRQNELAIALREIGRIERTLFILEWISSEALQRRAQMGLNKGEAHHALKRALNFNRRGEITDQTSENQHLRMLHLNLLAAIIIYWNTKHLGSIIRDKQQKEIHISQEQLAHLSPLGWEHIILTGFYQW